MKFNVGIHLSDARLQKLQGEARDRAHKAIKKAAFDIEVNAKQSMTGGPHTGRVYRIGNIMHRSSAPGEAPAVDTGTLINSIGVKMPNELLAVVYAGVEYALHLELGTVRIAPRPFMLPAMERERASFKKAMGRIVG